MEAAEAFVSALKAERSQEMARREQRRRYRNEFLVGIEKQRTVRSLERLRGDLWEQVSMTSSMEENLLHVVCRTTKWWEMLCKHSVDQRLQLEHAEENKVLQHEDYLKQVRKSERREAENILASDERRWQLIQQGHDEEEEDARMTAVSGAMDALFSALDKSLDFVESYSVAPSREDPLITFALQEVIQKEVRSFLSVQRLSERRASRSAVSVRKAQLLEPHREPLSDDEVAQHAFRTLFGHSPFQANSTEVSFSCLVAYYYHIHCPPSAAPTIYDLTQVPIFVIGGPKFSGKSALARFLQTKFDLQTVSAQDLVAKALAALEEQEDESERVESDLPPESSDHIWAALGRRVRTVLQQGGAVGADLIAELLAVKLGDAQQEPYNGLILDGLLSRPAEFEALRSALIPAVAHPFPRLQQYVQRNQTPSLTSRSRSASYALLSDSHSEQECELPLAWKLPRLVVDEAPNKKEQKTRANRKTGDASSLPPAELPELEDVSKEIETEQRHIAKAERELASQSGIFSSYIRIDCTPREVFKRFAGLRVDSETGEQYHMTYRPPPQDRMPFLVNADRTANFSAHLHSVVFAQEQQWKALDACFRRDAHVQGHIRHLNGECTVDELYQQGEDATNETLEHFVAGQRLYLSTRDSKARVQRLQEQHSRQFRVREEERARLAALYEEKNVPLPPELQPVEDSSAFYPIPQDLPATILSIASSMVDQYKADYAWGWSSLEDGSRVLLQYRRGCFASMDQFWLCPDDKQETLDRFIAAFNETATELRCKPACKDELHRYITDLSEALFVQVDKRQRDCVARTQQLTRREAFLEGWQAMIANTGTFLAHTEVERFVVTMNAILLHFGALMSEPLSFEDFDIDSSLLNMMTSEQAQSSGTTGGDTAPPATRAGRDGRKAASTKKNAHNKSAEEAAEHAVEDAFNDVVQRLTAALEGFVDKVKDTAEPSTKTQKKAAAPNAARLVALAARCAPPLETELRGAVLRIQQVKAFVLEMLHRGEQHVERIKTELQQTSRDRLLAQASAVNTAVRMLRNCVEQEVVAPAMHLGCGTFALLGQAPADQPADPLARAAAERSFLTDVPLFGVAQQAYKSLVHPTLSINRLLQLIQHFRSVAPNFQLSRSDFCLVVQQEDYRGAALEGETVKSVTAVFDSFDSQGVDLIDWREFVVHLMFWCCASPSAAASATAKALYIKEPTVEQLLETKSDIGLYPVSHDVFADLPFFYDDALDEERLGGYTAALWLTFENPETHMVDTFQLLWCLCADTQPIRGAQKAFYLLSAVDEGRLTLSELQRVFHANATNAQAVGKPDPFAESYLQLLLGESESVSFPEACVSVIGRKLLNGADMFRRRRFTVAV